MPRYTVNGIAQVMDHGIVIAVAEDADIAHEIASALEVTAAPSLLQALRYAQGEACGGCGDCLICTTLMEAE